MIPVRIKVENQSRMEVSRMSVDMLQRWKFADGCEASVPLLPKAHVVEPPLFPVPTKELYDTFGMLTCTLFFVPHRHTKIGSVGGVAAGL